MTLKEIAKKAGVSASTVSRVINGHNEKAASKEVQERIWEIVRAEGYAPNTLAQNLRRGTMVKNRTKEKSIACVYGRAGTPQNDAFFSSLARSIERAALRAGYVVKHTFSVYDMEKGDARQFLKKHRAGGLAVLGRCDRKTMGILKEQFQKVVYTGLNETELGCDQVICDGNAIALEAMRYLFYCGHKNIGYIGDTQQEIRYLAYREALKQKRIAVQREWVANACGTSEEGYEGAGRILKRTGDVTALFCMNDITAIGAIKRIQEEGLSVPKDISVISIDDIENAQKISPMLTTVRIPVQEMGSVVVKVLADRIEGGHTLPLKVTLPYQLLVRESCRKR